MPGAEFVIVPPISERTFAALAEAIGQPDLPNDNRFATLPERERNWETLWQIVEAWSQPQDADTVVARLEAAGCPCGRYRTVAEVIADPQLRDRGTIRSAVGGSGEFLVTASPVMSPDWPQQQTAARVPDLGADTAGVLQELAGFSKVDAMKVARHQGS